MNRMKKILFLGLLFLPLIVSAQTQESYYKYKKYTTNGVYTVDSGQIVVSRIIEDVPGTKDEIYLKVKLFFIQNYFDAKSTIQIDNKEAGLVIGKDLFRGFWTSTPALTWDCPYVLRIDIKDGRVRVLCYFSKIQYTQTTFEQYYVSKRTEDYAITDYEPFTDERRFSKGKQKEAFVHLIDTVQNTMNSLEKVLKVGSVKGENDVW